MAYQTQWHANGRIFHVKYIDTMRAADANELINAVIPKYFDNAPQCIHIIVDCTTNPDIEFLIREALQSEEAQMQFQHPNAGWTVTIADADWHFFFLFASVLEDKLQAKVALCHTLDEAFDFLKQQDPTLTFEDEQTSD